MNNPEPEQQVTPVIAGLKTVYEQWEKRDDHGFQNLGESINPILHGMPDTQIQTVREQLTIERQK